MEQRIRVEALVSKAQLAERLAVSPSCIDKWVTEKRIPYYRFGRRCVRYDVVEVLHALEKFHIPATRRFVRKPYAPRRRKTPPKQPRRYVQLDLNLQDDNDSLLLPLDL